MRLDWLESFSVFAEELNFTHAARRLHLSQPALHVQISKLAESLGCDLYARHGRELRLTQEGRRLEVQARKIVASAAKLSDEVRGEDVRERVTLCAGEGAYLYLLSQGVRKFGRGSSSQLRLLAGDTASTVDAVVQGRADIGVTVGGLRPSVLETCLLTEVRHVAVVPKDHPLAQRRRISVTSLRDQEMILPPPGRPLREVVHSKFEEAGLSYVASIEATGWEVMIRFVELGFGVAIVNESCETRSVVRAIPIFDLPSIRYELLWRRGSLSPSAESLRDTLSAEGDSWRS